MGIVKITLLKERKCFDCQKQRVCKIWDHVDKIINDVCRDTSDTGDFIGNIALITASQCSQYKAIDK